MLAESVAKSAEPLVESNSYRELQRLVDRFKDREQIAGIAVYSASGELLAISSGLAARLDQVPPPVLQSLGDGLTHAAFLRMGGDPDARSRAAVAEGPVGDRRPLRFSRHNLHRSCRLRRCGVAR